MFYQSEPSCDVIAADESSSESEDKSTFYVFCSTPAVSSGARRLQLQMLTELTPASHVNTGSCGNDSPLEPPVAVRGTAGQRWPRIRSVQRCSFISLLRQLLECRGSW